MAHEYVKISELVPTTSFGTTDQFVIVQNDETVKIVGSDLIQSLATLTNLATRSYVDAVVDSAPGTLDTLRELAAALNDDANFGANITALINEKLPTSNFGLEFWNQLATVNTYHISEGSNLYWTQDRFDSALASKNTYHIAEGSNLYFTDARARASLSAGEGIDYNSTTGVISAPGLSSDPTFNSVTTTTLNVKNVNFTGTGAVTISSGNDLNLVAAGHVAVNGETLSNVAFSGAYADLTGKPTLSTVAISGSYVDLINKPTLFSGSYNDLTDKNGSNGSIGVALGRWAGDYQQGESSIAIGDSAARWDQGSYAIAVGKDAGQSGQGAYAIAIGTGAGEVSQGAYAIAIGSTLLGTHTNQASNTIIINATGELISNQGAAPGFYVTPIKHTGSRVGLEDGAKILFYITDSREIVTKSIELSTVASTGNYYDLINLATEDRFQILATDGNLYANQRYGINTTDAPVEVYLPGSPAVGDAIFFADMGGVYSTNPLTIRRNGNTIMNIADDLTVSTDNESFGLCWNGTTWRIY
jgi:hypothetical protein